MMQRGASVRAVNALSMLSCCALGEADSSLSGCRLVRTKVMICLKATRVGLDSFSSIVFTSISQWEDEDN